MEDGMQRRPREALIMVMLVAMTIMAMETISKTTATMVMMTI